MTPSGKPSVPPSVPPSATSKPRFAPKEKRSRFWIEAAQEH
jgi:hypothetical protein